MYINQSAHLSLGYLKHGLTNGGSWVQALLPVMALYVVKLAISEGEWQSCTFFSQRTIVN